MCTEQLEKWLESLKQDATPSFEECLVVLGDFFPLLYELKNTIQDPEWHAEGNVQIHTEMVLSEVYSLLQTIKLSPEKRQSLILGALLHDIGKPFTTYKCEETGHIKASKHEQKGKEYLVFKLLELELDKEVYLEILELVGQHQKPKLLVIRDKEDFEYHKLMRDCDYMQLYYLELADMKGRTCKDLDIQLMYLEEFKNKCDLLLESKKLCINMEPISHIKGNFGLCNGEVSSSLEFESKYKYKYTSRLGSLTLMCGISGTGKSSYIDNAFKYVPETVVISLDDIRAELSFREDQSKNKEVVRIAEERLIQALRNEKHIVWDATNTRKEFRDKLIQKALDYKVLTYIQVLLAKEKVIHSQNKNRKYAVPDNVVSKQIKQFQLPTLSEAHIVSYTIN